MKTSSLFFVNNRKDAGKENKSAEKRFSFHIHGERGCVSNAANDQFVLFYKAVVETSLTVNSLSISMFVFL